MKRTTKKTEPDPKPLAPMDPSAREEESTADYVASARECYAITTLVDEVRALIPEVEHEVSNYAVYNTAHDVRLRLPDDADTMKTVDLFTLMDLVGTDSRVADVIEGGGSMSGTVLVEFRVDPVTRDSREPFGLDRAWAILKGDEQ